MLNFIWQFHGNLNWNNCSRYIAVWKKIRFHLKERKNVKEIKHLKSNWLKWMFSIAIFREFSKKFDFFIFLKHLVVYIRLNRLVCAAYLKWFFIHNILINNFYWPLPSINFHKSSRFPFKTWHKKHKQNLNFVTLVRFSGGFPRQTKQKKTLYFLGKRNTDQYKYLFAWWIQVIATFAPFLFTFVAVDWSPAAAAFFAQIIGVPAHLHFPSISFSGVGSNGHFERFHETELINRSSTPIWSLKNQNVAL